MACYRMTFNLPLPLALNVFPPFTLSLESFLFPLQFQSSTISICLSLTTSNVLLLPLLLFLIGTVGHNNII